MVLPVLQLIRFPNVFTAMSNIIVGYGVIAHLGGHQTNWVDLVIACLGAAMLYAFGMALNDIADNVVDQEIHPERPIPSGRISLSNATSIAVTLLVAGIVFLGLAQPLLIAIAMILAITIFMYDVILKGNPIAASVAMGSCRALCVLLGTILAACHAPESRVFFEWTTLQLPLAYLLLITVITAISNYEDRNLDIKTIQPLLGLLAIAFLTPVLVDSSQRLLIAAYALLLLGFIIPAGLPPNGKAGLVVRNAIFALPFFDAIWCLALGLPIFALACIALFVTVRISATCIGQATA